MSYKPLITFNDNMAISGLASKEDFAKYGDDRKTFDKRSLGSELDLFAQKSTNKFGVKRPSTTLVQINKGSNRHNKIYVVEAGEDSV